MTRLIGFDLDDTLTFNQHYYSLAQAELITHVISTLGPRSPSAPGMLELQVKKDLEGVKAKGFVMERFPESFSDTYIEIAKKLNVSEREYMCGAAEAYKIGEKVFDSNFWIPSLVPDAARVLDYLLSQNDELFLLTTGDPRVQQKKVDFYGLKKWFGKEIHIVPHHKKEKMMELISGKDKKNIWFVGNSAKSDIKPALEIGISAVYIPQETWDYDNHDLSTSNTSRLTEFKEIKEIVVRHEQLK